MSEYQSPAIVASYAAATLTADAAACATYSSDRDLKDEIREIDAALGQLGALREEGGASSV